MQRGFTDAVAALLQEVSPAWMRALTAAHVGGVQAGNGCLHASRHAESAAST